MQIVSMIKLFGHAQKLVTHVLHIWRFLIDGLKDLMDLSWLLNQVLVILLLDSHHALF